MNTATRSIISGLSRISVTVLTLSVLLIVVRAEEIQEQKKLFSSNCASCHGSDGKADTKIARRLGVKDLTQSRLSDAEIRQQIVEGRLDQNGKQQMPAFKDRLTEEQIGKLVEEVKAFRK